MGISVNDSIVGAIDKAQAMITFELDGTIIEANQNFLSVLGYHQDEIKGRHHRIFCTSAYVNSPEYRSFWSQLNRGEFHFGEIIRVTKTGREMWLSALYTPIFDDNGRPYRVVKIASDISRQKEAFIRLSEEMGVASAEINQACGGLLNRANASAGSARESATVATMAAQSLTDCNDELTTAAAGIEELNSAIGSLAQISGQAATIAQDAKERSNTATSRIDELGRQSKNIGGIVKVISSIASQTNLLALNATIEAARAGDLGKGFAVVASEVKNLARQTAEATSEIDRSVQTIQDSVSETVLVIQEIDTILNSLNEIAISTASAVEEQSVTTQELSLIVSSTSGKLATINLSVGAISRTASEDVEQSRHAVSAVEHLNEIGSRLNQILVDLKA